MEPSASVKLKHGDELVVSVDDAAFEGKTIARHEGLVIFVEGAVPGDTALVRILKSKKNFAEAKVVRIEQPSPYRVAPRCRHFGSCGGCKWQQVDYAMQLRFKQQHVVDSFERIGGFQNPNVLPIIGSADVFFYRNKMEYSFADKEWLDSPPVRTDDNSTASGSAGIYLGLHVPQRYDKVLEITECLLQSDTSNAILNFTRAFARRENLPVYVSDANEGYLRFLVIRESRRMREVMVNLVTFDDRPDAMKKYSQELLAAVPAVTTIVNTINTKKAQIAFGETEKVYAGEGIIREQLGGFSFTISASSFFQTNTAQAERLYSVAKQFGALRPTDVVWDLYSGTGSIALFVAGSVRHVIGVESVADAVKDAERNARANGITNCSFVLGDLKDRLTSDRSWIAAHPRPDVMIIDPPRSGMHPKVVDEILGIGPERIVYVSCNPATQARDVKILGAKYDIAELQPVDMFPHTYHIENVARLTLRRE